MTDGLISNAWIPAGGVRRIGVGLRGIVLLSVLLAFTACNGAPEPGAPPDGEPHALAGITRPVEAGSVHLVRMTQSGDQYAFEPADITIAPGDVVRFVMVGGQPESVAFDTTEADPGLREFIRTHSLHLGVLLTKPGQTYDVRFEGAPPGVYPFVSLPHSVHGMRGRVIVSSTQGD